jgi:hypothetical protein
MVSNLFDFGQVKQSATFGVIDYKHSIYKGELLNGKRCG